MINLKLLKLKTKYVSYPTGTNSACFKFINTISIKTLVLCNSVGKLAEKSADYYNFLI